MKTVGVVLRLAPPWFYVVAAATATAAATARGVATACVGRNAVHALRHPVGDGDKRGLPVVVLAPVGDGLEGHVGVEEGALGELREEGLVFCVEAAAHEHDLYNNGEQDLSLGEVFKRVTELGLLGHRRHVPLVASLEEV